MVIEAEKSKRPVFKRLEFQESQWYKFQSKFKSEGKSRLMSQLKDRQREFFLIPFVLFRPSVVDWSRPTHCGKSNLFTLFISSRNTPIDTLKNDV